MEEIYLHEAEMISNLKENENEAKTKDTMTEEDFYPDSTVAYKA